MDGIYIAVIVLLLALVAVLVLRQYALAKRIREMRDVVDGVLDGQKKLQIFSSRQDGLSKLAWQVNRLASLYGAEQEKYEREQVMKRQLIANLSHDVRTPLVSVIGYLEAIIEKRISDNQREDYTRTAYNKSLVLKEQIDQLFVFAQSDAKELLLQLEKLDVCEITRQVLLDCLPAEEGSLELDVSISEEELMILADKDSFVRILQNLLRNTLTHGAEGNYLGVFVKKEESNVIIDIADKGKGIDHAHLPYVFERLYKADDVRSTGGGLGLAIARELSNKMNGDVAILRSLPGDTVFRITFPEAS